MARFVFELQAVLDQRVREERERQRELAECEAGRREVVARVERLQARLREERATLVLGLAQTVDLRRVREQAGVALHIERLLRESAADLAVATDRCEAARARLAAAAARRRAAELLRERRQAEWARDQRRRDAAASDDQTNARYGRGGLAA